MSAKAPERRGFAIFQYTTMNADGQERALEILDAAIEHTSTEGPDDRPLGEEFPTWFANECRERFAGRPSDEVDQLAAEARRPSGGRSFPTDYPAWAGDLRNGVKVAAHIAAVREQLGPVNRARAKTADYRVWYGPGPADNAALPHIEDAYYAALGVLDRAGLLTPDPWQKLPALPAVLDLVVRDLAQRMARDREGLLRDERLARYGWDPYRIAIEHAQLPDLLDSLINRSGLRARGTTCPSSE